MLHEILLSLSGHPSPLFDQQKRGLSKGEDPFPLLSPAETSLLQSLGHLSDLHRDVKSYSSAISSSHPSTICRAVATAITSVYLAGFQQKVLGVERSVLLKDAEYVGGYDIVPLSTIVSDFSPWTRRFEWLWEVVQIIQPEGASHARKKNGKHSCSGASIIDQLRRESQTGYRDIEEMALALVNVAETAWLRQLSTWVLYGKLPSFGAEDFFVQGEKGVDSETEDASEFNMHTRLLPKFVSPSTASSIFFVGKTLNHIRTRHLISSIKTNSLASPEMTLLPIHLKYLSSLKSPISAADLTATVSAIRLSLSQTTLSQLLPLSRIVEVISLLHSYLLLGNGEFSHLLIDQADKCMSQRQRRSDESVYQRGKSQSVGSIRVKDGEIAAVLSQTLSELFTLNNEDDSAEEELDLARDLLRLSVAQTKPARPPTPGRDQDDGSAEIKLSDTPFNDLLFPSPTSLSIVIRSPLDLFLNPSDLVTYSAIHSYLLSIRRCHIHLSGLWKHTSLRRSHPAPWGPPLSNSRGGKRRLEQGRQRENERTRLMRPIWAVSSAAIFLLSELGGYLQGEVVNGSWEHFRQWLDPPPPEINSIRSRPASSHSVIDKGDAPSHTTEFPHHDPETLSIAHRTYLRSISQAIFLTDKAFTDKLRTFLNSIDYFVALMTRLQTVQQNLDLETDEGVVDTFANYANDEKELLGELSEARLAVQDGVRDVVDRLREIDEYRLGGSRVMDHYTMKDSTTYVPWRGIGVDQLLLKLDFGTGLPQGDVDDNDVDDA